MAGRRIKQGKVPDRSKVGNSRGSAPQRPGTIRAFFGILAGKTKKVATIEEMNEAAAAGWAGLSGTDGSKRRDGKRKSPW